GQTQFGRHRDDFGNWFGNNNPTWLWHYFFPEHYLARNPLLPLKTTKKLLANYKDATFCFPASRTLSRFNDAFAANHVTSGNSPTPYRDELFGSEFANSVFISEPVHNLVHREVLEPDGVTFTSRRANDEANTEFVASSDNWFRPTMLKTGPDGALYIADMYRLVIEHPEWIPAEMQKRLDLRAGDDKGRIYRVYPGGVKLRRVPNLVKLSASELAGALDSPNGWQRDTAQRLLLERGDKSVVSRIESLAKDAKSAKVRVQALWTLNGLNALGDQALIDGLTDESAAVREHAVRLSEFSLSRAPASGEIAKRVLLLANDANARVRYQAAFTLGEWNDSRAAETLLALLRDGDENIRNAALSSAPRHARAMFQLIERLPRDDRARTALVMLKKLATNPPALAGSTAIIERTKGVSAAHRAERENIVRRYAAVSTLRGNSTAGAPLFKQHCSQCHRLRDKGVEIGPDLGMASGKSIEQLVQAILDPNAAVEARYQLFTVTTSGDEEISGVIVSETPNSLTLRAVSGGDRTFLRSAIVEISTSRFSLMPDGFESAMTPRQLADLIAFLTGRE
ncbi:MAG TPA: HEAT repeat domain-containing protein, partial [Candidatus Acidoferrum sp.]|nr:HEAT repeat domain-containing protein [Candidatus Acidoferrum sp.]